MGTDLRGIQRGNPNEKVKQQIIALGTEFDIMTRYTSFVAVEEKTVTVGGQPVRVDVPVELPEGVSYEGLFGEGGAQAGGAVPRGRAMMLGRGAATGAVPKAAARPANAPAPAQPQVEAADTAEADDDADGQADNLTEAQRKEILVQRKLAKALQSLTDKLDGQGNYRAGNVIVRDGKVTVAVYLSKLDDEVRKALRAAGLTIELESAPAKMVLGTIAVDKLDELALVDAVRSVDPPSLTR
jgi:Ca-activated chloride channel family protein